MHETISDGFVATNYGYLKKLSKHKQKIVQQDIHLLFKPLLNEFGTLLNSIKAVASQYRAFVHYFILYTRQFQDKRSSAKYDSILLEDDFLMFTMPVHYYSTHSKTVFLRVPASLFSHQFAGILVEVARHSSTSCLPFLLQERFSSLFFSMEVFFSKSQPTLLNQ